MNPKPNISEKAWALYNFVKARTLGTTLKVTQREIFDHLKSQGFQISWSEAQNMHNDHCRSMKDLVDEINFSTTLDKMVYQEDWQYCIANEEQAETMRRRYHERAMVALERESIITSKCRRDGQGKCVNNAGNEMKPGNKEFHEAFNRPKAPEYQELIVTVDEEVQGGLHYSQVFRMPVPVGISDDEIESHIKSQLRTGLTLTHWRKV